MAPHQSPIGVRHISQQRVNVGVAQPRALLAPRTIDESVGRAELKGACADLPNQIESLVGARKRRVAGARVSPLGRAGILNLRSTARDDRRIAKTHRLETFKTF